MVEDIPAGAASGGARWFVRTSSQPTTILFVAWAPFFSGAERALVLLVEHLDRTRFRPAAVLGTDGQLQRELESLGVPTTTIPTVYTGLRTLPSWAWSISRIVRFARSQGAALVHANDAPSFQPAGYAARLLRCPALTHIRYPDTAEGYGWFLKPGFDRALFVSEAFRREAVRDAPVLFQDRSECVHDGVRIPTASTDADRQRLRLELGLSPSRTLVAFSGQIAEIKGIWDFVDAAHQLLSHRSDVSFVVMGDDLKGHGELRRQVEARVANLGHTDHFTFLGFRTDALRLVPAFDIVAVPSHVEPLGLVVLEAMAAGKPVVGARVGGIPEIIVDLVTGRLVPPREPEALASAIATLLDEPLLQSEYGHAGRRRAEQEFCPERHARRVEQVYGRLLDLPGGAPD